MKDISLKRIKKGFCFCIISFLLFKSIIKEIELLDFHLFITELREQQIVFSKNYSRSNIERDFEILDSNFLKYISTARNFDTGLGKTKSKFLGRLVLKFLNGDKLVMSISYLKEFKRIVFMIHNPEDHERYKYSRELEVYLYNNHFPFVDIE